MADTEDFNRHRLLIMQSLEDLGKRLDKLTDKYEYSSKELNDNIYQTRIETIKGLNELKAAIDKDIDERLAELDVRLVPLENAKHRIYGIGAAISFVTTIFLSIGKYLFEQK